MALLSTEKWKRIGTIASALVALGTVVWSTIVFASNQIDKKIEIQTAPIIEEKIDEHADETVKQISKGLNAVQLQMLFLQERLVKSDIRDLTQNKTMDELTASEKSEFEYLLQEQKIIQEQKQKIKKPN